jgi:hypothetical protein
MIIRYFVWVNGVGCKPTGQIWIVDDVNEQVYENGKPKPYLTRIQLLENEFDYTINMLSKLYPYEDKPE